MAAATFPFCSKRRHADSADSVSLPEVENLRQIEPGCPADVEELGGFAVDGPIVSDCVSHLLESPMKRTFSFARNALAHAQCDRVARTSGITLG